MKSTPDRDIILRTVRSTGVVLLIALVFGMYYAGFYPALGFFFGGVWGIINLLTLRQLVQAALRPEGVDIRRTIVIALIKFPLLYASGYFLLASKLFEPWILMAGFSLMFVVFLLKAVGRALLRLDDSRQKLEQIGRAA